MKQYYAYIRNYAKDPKGLNAYTIELIDTKPLGSK
jgi:hypothetical protein